MNPLALIGVWNGHVIIEQFTVLIILEVMKTNFNKNAPVNALIDIPDLYVERYFISQLSVNGNKVEFYLPSLEGNFSGNFDEKEINGFWKNEFGQYKIEMKKTSNFTAYNKIKPQTPNKPYPYSDEEVLIKTKDGVILSGTFTYPTDKKATKAVVLAHGSGGMDRDEKIWEHKPFMVIADYLTRNGIAVLRYDERGIGSSTGDFNSAAIVDFANDALEGIDYLRHRKDFMFKEIGIIGHSKGGLTAVAAADKSDSVDFIVLLGGVIIKVRDSYSLQILEFNKVFNRSLYIAESHVRLVHTLISLSENLTDVNLVRQKILKYIDDRLQIAENEEEALSLVILRRDAIQNGFAEQYVTPYFRSAYNYEPRALIKNMKIPILGLWGSKDLHVAAKENGDALEEILKNGKANRASRAIILDGLNHIFQTTTTGSPFEIPVLEETFSPRALKVIKDWILEQNIDIVSL